MLPIIKQYINLFGSNWPTSEIIDVKNTEDLISNHRILKVFNDTYNVVNLSRRSTLKDIIVPFNFCLNKKDGKLFKYDEMILILYIFRLYKEYNIPTKSRYFNIIAVSDPLKSSEIDIQYMYWCIFFYLQTRINIKVKYNNKVKTKQIIINYLTSTHFSTIIYYTYNDSTYDKVHNKVNINNTVYMKVTHQLLETYFDNKEIKKNDILYDKTIRYTDKSSHLYKIYRFISFFETGRSYEY